MRKVIFNKWFLLAFFLMASLSAISFAAYQKAHSAEREVESCCTDGAEITKDRSAVILDAISRQFTSLVTIQ